MKPYNSDAASHTHILPEDSTCTCKCYTSCFLSPFDFWVSFFSCFLLISIQALVRLNPLCYTCSCMGTSRRNIAQPGETRKLRPKVEAMVFLIASCPAEQLTATDRTGPLRKEDTSKDINNEGVM